MNAHPELRKNKARPCDRAYRCVGCCHGVGRVPNQPCAKLISTDGEQRGIVPTMKLSALFRQVLAWPQWTVRAKRTSRKPRKLAGRRRWARSSLAFTPVAGILLLIAGWSFADTYVPEITDTEYHHRLGVIRTAVAEHPRNPLAVIVGSSRMVWGFRPETLPEPQPGELYWLNSSHVGGGPILNRLMMHRLLRDGVKPDVVVLEVMPAFFMRENTRFVMSHFTASELKTTRGYGKFPLIDYLSFETKSHGCPTRSRVRPLRWHQTTAPSRWSSEMRGDGDRRAT